MKNDQISGLTIYVEIIVKTRNHFYELKNKIHLKQILKKKKLIRKDIDLQ